MLRAAQRGVGRALGSQWDGVILRSRCSSGTRGEATSAAGEPEASTSGRERSSYGALPWLAASAVAAAALGTGFARQEQAVWRGDSSEQGPAATCMAAPWVQQLAARDGHKLILSAESMHHHPLLKRDHMFTELHRHEMVEDLVCFFSESERSLSYVIQLGKTQHGGLTAALIDEAFGFLWLSLRSHGLLPFRGPAFTAHLEVDYKARIPAGRLLLCTTEVESCEGRKLWMRATVREAPGGKVYATARALFVCPNTQRLLQEGVKIAYDWLRA